MKTKSIVRNALISLFFFLISYTGWFGMSGGFEPLSEVFKGEFGGERIYSLLDSSYMGYRLGFTVGSCLGLLFLIKTIKNINFRWKRFGH